MNRLEQEKKARILKASLLREKQKINPFPSKSERNRRIYQILYKFRDLEKNKKEFIITGRLKAIRIHGRSSFANIEDETGNIQLFLSQNDMGESYNIFKNFTDLGDFIQVSGSAFKTKKGEKTVLVKKFKIIAKSFLPLPEKWHGLSDTELRYRKRYLDFIANPELKKNFYKRSKIISSIRNFLDDNGFIEVDTPILQPLPGGANARPFKTYHNSLESDFYLRIAPELYLKRLIIGGFEKVYEVARCFRNEGIDRDHNPEFTQVEFYAAYWDYQKMMEFAERLMEFVVMETNQSLTLIYEGNEIDFTIPFKRISFKDACYKYASLDIELDDKSLLNELKKRKIKISPPINRAKILDEIFKEFVRPQIIQPTFITNHPLELSPLAKKDPRNPNYTERFQLIAGRKEISNAFSELNDPIDQKERFKKQEAMRKSGDEEAQRIDNDFLDALSQGMPPTAGIGIGIDRLTALLTNNHNIKEIILFPTLKPKKNGPTNSS